MAQRDLLRRLKMEKRQQELYEFNSNNGPSGSNPPIEEVNVRKHEFHPPQATELEKRRMIYKNVRKDILDADQAAKEKVIANKMRQMETKVEQREQDRRNQAELYAQQAAASDHLRKQTTQKNKNFLDNLESFNVD